MKRELGVLMIGLLIFSVFVATPAFAFNQGGLAARLNGEATEDDVVFEAVAGKSFFGEFTNSCGNSATSCMSFDLQGNISWDQDLGTGPFVFFGTYDETAFGPFSLWAANLADGSPDGQFSLAGVAVGPFLFLRLSNRDETCPDGTPLTARGRYRLSTCTPGQRPSATGSSGESAIAGAP